MMVRKPKETTSPQGFDADTFIRKKKISPKNFNRNRASPSPPSSDTSPGFGQLPIKTPDSMWRGSGSVCESPENGDERGDADTNQSLHPLHNRWKFWYRSTMDASAWGANLKELKSFGTVEEFWRIFNAIKSPSEMPIPSSYFIFKEHLRPEWEDKGNCRGGRWLFTFKKHSRINDTWQEILLGLVGEIFDADGDEICGVALDIRARFEKISVWTKNWQDKDRVLRIGEKIKQCLLMEELRLGPGVELVYEKHEDSHSKKSKADLLVHRL